MVRASQVSTRWREIVSDDHNWKTLCERHAYRRMSSDSIGSMMTIPIGTAGHLLQSGLPRSTSPPRLVQSIDAIAENSDNMIGLSSSLLVTDPGRRSKRARPKSTHRSHFKHRYLVESAWRKGGRMTPRHITPDQGVVTSLHLTKKYIIVALDNAKIHIFNIQGDHQRTLNGHMMGVWAMVPWDNILVSGGCDRDVRVWDMSTG